MNFLSQLENEKKGHIYIKVSDFPKIENNNHCLELINYCALEFSKALLRSQEVGSETFDCTINLEGIRINRALRSSSRSCFVTRSIRQVLANRWERR